MDLSIRVFPVVLCFLPFDTLATTQDVGGGHQIQYQKISGQVERHSRQAAAEKIRERHMTDSHVMPAWAVPNTESPLSTWWCLSLLLLLEF